jgi:tRNA G10  N-methylase Trm11
MKELARKIFPHWTKIIYRDQTKYGILIAYTHENLSLKELANLDSSVNYEFENKESMKHYLATSIRGHELDIEERTRYLEIYKEVYSHLD